MKTSHKILYIISYAISIVITILGFLFLYLPSLGDHNKYKTISKLSKAGGDNREKQSWRKGGLSLIILGICFLLIITVLYFLKSTDYQQFFKPKHLVWWYVSWIVLFLSIVMIITGFLFLYLPSLGDHGKFKIGVVDSTKGDSLVKGRYRTGGVSLIFFGLLFLFISLIGLYINHHLLKSKNYILGKGLDYLKNVVGPEQFSQYQKLIKGEENNYSQNFQDPNFRREVKNSQDKLFEQGLKDIPKSVFFTNNSEDYKNLIYGKNKNIIDAENINLINLISKYKLYQQINK